MATVVVAASYGGPEVLTVVEQPVSDPGPGEVRIEVRAAGVNQADVKSYSGIWGTDPAALPKRLGFEVSGEVTAVGADALGPSGPVSVGDEVIAFQVTGGYASELVVPADTVVSKPAGLGWAEAAGLMLTGAAAWHALSASGVDAGETILVHGGAGGVGLMALQQARLRGVRVVATAPEESHDVVREYGADPVMYGPGLADRVRAAAPDGIASALDLVGSEEALTVSLELVPDPQRIASIANFSPEAAAANIKRLGAGDGGDPGTEIRNAARPELARLAADGALRVRVGRTFALTDAADAHRLLASGQAPPGKLVLLP